MQERDPKAHKFLGHLYEREGELNKAVGCYKVEMMMCCEDIDSLSVIIDLFKLATNLVLTYYRVFHSLCVAHI